MLSAVSWAQFLEGVAGACIVYYAVIILLYYRKDATGLLGRPQAATMAAPGEPHDALLPQVHEVITGVKNVLNAAASQQYAWNETVFAVQQVLKDYPQLAASRYTIAINNEINYMAAETLGNMLSEEELQAVWN